METNIKYVFINKNNYADSSTVNANSVPVEPRGITRKAIDMFRRKMGNYWFLKQKGRQDQLFDRQVPNSPTATNNTLPLEANSTLNPKSNFKFQRESEIPFKIKVGKTYNFYNSKRLPSTAKITPITLVAETKYFGPYPECRKCWYRYLFGEDYADPSKRYETIFGFDTLRLQDIESGFIGSRGQTYRKRLPKTPLYILLLSDAGLPTPERLSSMGVEEVKLLGYKLKQRLQQRTQALAETKIILFEDSYFTSDIAKDASLSNTLLGKSEGSLTAGITSEYNFYPMEYEQYVKDNNITEPRLPNVYALAAGKGTVPVVLKLRNEIECLEKKLKFLIQKNDLVNILVPGSSVSFVNKFYPFQALVPYYNAIKLDTDGIKVINPVVEEQKMDGSVLRHISETPHIESKQDFFVFKQIEGTKRRRGRAEKVSGIFIENGLQGGSSTSVKSWEFYEWIMKFHESIKDLSFQPLPTGTIFLSPTINESVQNAIKTSSYYNKMMRLVALTTRVNQIIHEYSRTYQQLIAGTAPHKEVIAYRIAKHFKQNSSENIPYNTTDLLTESFYTIQSDFGPPIQNFWFFNSTEEEIINYVDSQILTNTDYTYLVYAYPLVLGSEYFYSNVGRVKLKKPVDTPPEETIPSIETPQNEDTPCDQFAEMPNLNSTTNPTPGLGATPLSLTYFDLLLSNYYQLLITGLPYLEALKQSLELAAQAIAGYLQSAWYCNGGVVTCQVKLQEDAIQNILLPKYGDLATAYDQAIRLENQITRVLLYCLDGTYMAKFGPQATTVILGLIRTFAAQRYISFTSKCNCPEATEPMDPTPIVTGEEDPCTLVVQLTRQADMSDFAPSINPTDSIAINEAIASKLGLNSDLNNLSEQDVEDLKNRFVETLELLSLRTGNPNLDPNTGEIALTIENYFDDLEDKGEFDLVEFVLFISTVRLQSNIGSNNIVTKNIPRGLFGNSATLELLLNFGIDFGADTAELEASITYEEIVSECPERLLSDQAGRLFGEIAAETATTGTPTTIEVSCDCIPGEVIEEDGDKKCKISMLATVVPKPVIFEVPFFIASAKVNNDLPIAPDVQFIPYKDINNTILINFNSMEGQYRTKFVPILPSDYDYYESLKINRSLDENELLQFSNDDNIKFFESFRIENHPTSFEDFEGAIYRRHKTYKRNKVDYSQVNAFQEMDSVIYSNSTSVDEVLEPNTKYYYIFRTVDENNNISNPSRIFEVELVNDSGATYPVIRTVDFMKTEIKKNSRDMKRFLLINPTFSHVNPTLFSNSKIEEGAISAFDVLQDYQADVGIEHNLWAKRFKIRVTSLKSGRKLDININPRIEIIDERTSCDIGQQNPSNLS
jgi:hypothetical protein